MTPKTEKMLRAAMLKSDRARVERAYQRAMNIRDSTPGGSSDIQERHYTNEYRKAYKSGDFLGFRLPTRRYLKMLRVRAEVTPIESR